MDNYVGKRLDGRYEIQLVLHMLKTLLLKLRF